MKQPTTAGIILRRAGLAALFLGVGVLLASCSAAKKPVPGPEAAAAMDAERGSRVSVSVLNPQSKAVQGHLVLNGTIRADNEVQVLAETGGKVVKVYVDTGARVSKGDVLVQIDDELKQAAFETAQAAFEKSQSDWKRAQGLYAQKVISDVELQGTRLAFISAKSQLITSRKDLDHAKVVAPIAGVVTQKLVNEGTVLSVNSAVAHIVDTQDLKLVLQVGERDVLKIRKGMPVQIDSDLYPGSTFPGRVSAISPKGDAAMTFPVEIKLTSDARKPLYDGMSARAHVDLGERTIVALPRTSLVNSYQKPQVFVIRGGVARLVDVVIGGEYGTEVDVISGLTAADQVVTSGQNNLIDGQGVDVVGEDK
jgi:membrane fusion protein, multidrug efflux system